MTGRRLFGLVSGLERALVWRYWRLRLGFFGGGGRIYRSVRIYQASRVRVGHRTFVNDFVHIWGGGGVIIGDDSMVAAHTVITSQSHDLDALSLGTPYWKTNISAPVVIGNNVWIGSSVVILPGVTIGDGAVVGAGAVVTKDVPAECLATGVPARVVKRLGLDG